MAETFLFVPGWRPERFDKAVASGADVVILDLEDSVASDAKDAARSHVRRWLSEGGVAAVRVNAVTTTWNSADLVAARGAEAIVLPKAESPDDVRRVRSVVGDEVPIIPLIETARGLLASEEMCQAAGVARMAFGNVDLAAQLGVEPSSYLALQAARSHVVHTSAAAGLAPPIDGVTTNIYNEEMLRADLQHARSLGFTAKLLIHPGQVIPTVEVLAPSAAELSWARSVLDSSGAGVGVHQGEMVDAPVLTRARSMLARAASRRQS